MKLRPYQQEAYDAALKSFEAHKSILLVLATGLGKTVIAAHVANYFAASGRILLLAHRAELIYQGKATLENVTGLNGEIEMAGEWARRSNLFGSDFVISTIQTQSRGRMERFNPAEFSLVIIDECHHATAPTYRLVIDHYSQNPETKFLGLTATPDRADEKALGAIFEDVPFEYDILDGIEDGWLVPIQQQSVVVDGLDYSTVRTVAGDLNGADLNAILEFESNIHGMTTPILDLCGDDKTLVFTASVAQAERMTEILNRHKATSAEFVSGETPKEVRSAIFNAYKEGDIQYLVNCNVTTEGFDEPGIQHVVLAKPTKSRSLYAQMIGRGTRPLPGLLEHIDGEEQRKDVIGTSGKPILNVIDFVGNAGKHHLVHCTDVLGGDYDLEVIQIAQKAIDEADGEPREITSELVQAEREWERRKAKAAEAAKRAAIKIKSNYHFKSIDPFNVMRVEPCREKGWGTGRPATDKQRDRLRSWGIEAPPDLSFTHAHQLIGRMLTRFREGNGTLKHVAYLNRKGYMDAIDWTFQQCSDKITEISKAEGWWKPYKGQKRS